MYEDDDDVVQKDAAEATKQPSYPERIRQRLRAESASLGEQKARSDRALDILNRHPEFEDLLELIALVGLPIKIPATYTVDPLVTE